jgi:hypothetical protein
VSEETRDNAFKPIRVGGLCHLFGDSQSFDDRYSRSIVQSFGQVTATRAHGKSAVPEPACCADRSNLSTEQDDVPYCRAAGPLNTYVYVYASDERGRAA